MSWALTMASMYGPPPGWEGGTGTGWEGSAVTGWDSGKGTGWDSGKGNALSWDSGKGNGWDSGKGKGPGKGKTGAEQPLSEPSCKAGSVSAQGFTPRSLSAAFPRSSPSPKCERPLNTLETFWRQGPNVGLIELPANAR